MHLRLRLCATDADRRPGTSDTPLIGGKRKAIQLALRPIVRRSAATIVTSREGRDTALGLGAPDVRLIPNGIDLQAFAPQTAEPSIDILFVGQLIALKGVTTLLRAVATIEPRPTLVLVGEGPDRAEFTDLARSLGVAADFRGRVENSEVAALLGRARCFVLPSITEGQPKALLEAMASGVASVASDIPAHRELAEFGGVRLFPEGDPAALAAAFVELLGDEEQRRQLGTAGRSAIRERFDLGTLLETEVDLLGEVAARRTARGPR